MRRVVLLWLALALFPPALSLAQEGTPEAPATQAEGTYENPDLGLALTLPDGWETRTEVDTLILGSAEALATLDSGQTPQDLVVRILTGAFTDLNIGNASELPAQLSRLVPTGISAPEPTAATYGNAAGWEVQFTVPEGDLTTRVALLNLDGGRVALIRGIAATPVWESEAQAQYQALVESLNFSLPTSLADPFASVPDNDGGVIWQYQAAAPTDGSVAPTLGGMAYDPFLLMYIAAGARGILVLDQTNGGFVNYLGPWFDDDNLVDIAIGIDAKIYVANATSGDNNQIMIVNRAGGFERGFGSVGDAPGQFAPGMPRTIAVTRNYDIWTVSEGHSSAPTNRLYKFDRFGNLLEMIDIDTINPDLSNIRLDNNISTGGLYMVGETGGLNLLDADGQPLVTNLGLNVFRMTNPVDVAIAPGDYIIVGTSSEGYLQFAPSGALLDRFGIPFDPASAERFQPGQMLTPGGTVVDIASIIYFAETNPTTGFSQVQAFRFQGDGNLALPNRPGSGQGTGEISGLDPAAGGGQIEYGAVVQGSLNNQHPVHEWRFEGQAGDRVRITMRDISAENTLDPLLRLVDPNLRDIALVDDVGALAPEGFDSTDSVIEFDLSSFGFYVIEATRFGGRGEYELTLELISD